MTENDEPEMVPMSPWQQWVMTHALAAHAVAVMLVRGHEGIRCTCGADIPFDRDADILAATDKAVRRHLADAAPDLAAELVSGCPSGDCDCCGWRFLEDSG